MRQSITALAIATSVTMGCASISHHTTQVAPTAALPEQQETIMLEPEHTVLPNSPMLAADRIEEALAENIDVTDVFRCDVPDAQRLLVHVRQAYYREPEPMDRDRPDAEAIIQDRRRRYANINKVQCAIVDVLTDLIKVTGTNTIMSEGVSRIPRRVSIAKEYYRILDTLERGTYITAPIPNKKTSTDADIWKELPSRYPTSSPAWHTYACIPGAPFLMALRGQILIAPAETPRSEAHAYRVKGRYEKHGKIFPPDHVAIMDNREDAVLTQATKVPAPVSIVVYGAGHAFGGKQTCGDTYEDTRKSHRDNIAKWNAKHPREKFSLLEITIHGLPVTVKKN